VHHEKDTNQYQIQAPEHNLYFELSFYNKN
jgi:hypothetical protein